MFGIFFKKKSERTLIFYVIFSRSAKFICAGKIKFNLFILILVREFLTKNIWMDCFFLENNCIEKSSCRLLQTNVRLQQLNKRGARLSRQYWRDSFCNVALCHPFVFLKSLVGHIYAALSKRKMVSTENEFSANNPAN